MRQSNLCSKRSNLFSQSFSRRADASSRLLSHYSVTDIVCASLIFPFEFVHYSILHVVVSLEYVLRVCMYTCDGFVLFRLSQG